MRVYVAGPYTNGDIAVNVRNATEAAEQLLKAGHSPFLPHLTHFWHLLYPGTYEQWTDYDLVWLAQCEAMVRLPGYSLGSVNEEKEAGKLGIPVYYSVSEFLSKTKGN